MRWDRGHNSSNIEDRRSEGGRGLGGGGGGGLPLGALLAVAGRFGWKGILVALVVVGGLMYGGNLCNGSSAPSQQAVPSETRGAASDDEAKQFVGAVLDDAQKTWGESIPGYQDAKLVLFRNAIRSACGTATSAVGPFYCQLDHKVYIDLAFYDDLRSRFGAPGDFAQAYVIAHEIGHHVQNLRNLLGKDEASSVKVELQADCIAGAWAKSANARGLLEVGDIDEALNAASQIGDDTIQRKTQGRVQPETFTHGSAAQRTAAFRKGYEGGLADCGIR
ncbi:MAG: neutral zinc metallopeptidase [Myxococcales bacterium]|nr:neutral zinc metallopeptidase [Myxococcales bacterium]